MSYEDRTCPTCSTQVPPGATECPNCGAAAPEAEPQDVPTDPAETIAHARYWARSHGGGGSKLGMGIGAIVTVFVLGIGGFIAYTVWNAFNSVNKAVEATEDVFDDIPIPTPGQFGGLSTNADFIRCVNELAIYVDFLYESDGTNDTAVKTVYGKDSFEYRTVRTVYRRSSKLVPTEGKEVAVRKAADMLGARCKAHVEES